MGLLPPRAKCFLEDARTRRAFFYRKNRALAAGVHDRDVEPVPLLQQLKIALLVGLDSRQADQEITVGDFHRQAGEWNTASLFALFHQHTRNVADSAFRKIRR